MLSFTKLKPELHLTESLGQQIVSVRVQSSLIAGFHMLPDRDAQRFHFIAQRVGIYD